MARYLLLAALIQIVWGLTPSASRVILEYLPVESYSAIRYSLSGIFFLIYTLTKNGSLKHRRKDLPILITLGIFAYGVDSLGTLYGLKIGGVLNFSLASSMNAVITSFVALIALKERPSSGFTFACILSIGGGLILFLGKHDVSNFQVAGTSLLLIWGAYFFEALGFVGSKKYCQKIPLTEYLAILQLSAAAFMWGLSTVTDRLPVKLFEMPSHGWLALGFVCIFSCCLCYLALYWLLNHIDGHRLAFFDCFHTLSATLFSLLLFQEPFNLKMILGGIALLAAVAVVTFFNREKSTVTEVSL